MVPPFSGHLERQHGLCPKEPNRRSGADSPTFGVNLNNGAIVVAQVEIDFAVMLCQPDEDRIFRGFLHRMRRQLVDGVLQPLAQGDDLEVLGHEDTEQPAKGVFSDQQHLGMSPPLDFDVGFVLEMEESVVAASQGDNRLDNIPLLLGLVQQADGIAVLALPPGIGLLDHSTLLAVPDDQPCAARLRIAIAVAVARQFLARSDGLEDAFEAERLNGFQDGRRMCVEPPRLLVPFAQAPTDDPVD